MALLKLISQKYSLKISIVLWKNWHPIVSYSDIIYLLELLTLTTWSRRKGSLTLNLIRSMRSWSCWLHEVLAFFEDETYFIKFHQKHVYKLPLRVHQQASNPTIYQAIWEDYAGTVSTSPSFHDVEKAHKGNEKFQYGEDERMDSGEIFCWVAPNQFL